MKTATSKRDCTVQGYLPLAYPGPEVESEIKEILLEYIRDAAGLKVISEVCRDQKMLK